MSNPQKNFSLGLILALTLLTGIALAASNPGRPVSPQVQIPDELLISDPSLSYDDTQEMTDISGTATAIFRVKGEHTFCSDYNEVENALTTRVKMDLTMMVRYTRQGNVEVIESTVQGMKTTIKDAPARGRDPKKFPYSTGYFYYPAFHSVTKETYSGQKTRRLNGTAIPTITWSPGQKLACFNLKIGDSPSGWPSHRIGIPVTIRYEEDRAYDDQHERYAATHQTEFTAVIPSCSTANSRFAQIINKDSAQKLADSVGGWVETVSPHGTTNGAFAKQMVFENCSWITEGMFKRGSEPSTDLNENVWSGSVEVRWALGNKMPQGKMTIAPTDIKKYTEWIPAPIDDERYGGPGETLQFTARILPKEDGKPAPQGRVHFWLTEVSREKGRCSNYPVDGDARDDLRFKPNQQGLIIDPQNPRHAYTDKPCAEATVQIEATDTGAYGSLQATCDDLGLIAEDQRTQLQAIAVPMDDNRNHVADAWERSRGLLQDNSFATEDEDRVPANQRRLGDGYTFYEEYRGFMTKAGFIRSDPRRKDLFIYDPDGLVKQWYEPANPAQLVLHYIDPTMMKFNGEARDPANRWVNCNSSPSKWYARQYALYVKEWPTMSDKTIGEVSWHTYADQLNGIYDAYGGFEEPLKKIYIIKIAPGTLEKCLSGIADPAVRQDTFNKMMASSVIHEIGHGLGIRHHSPIKDGETAESVQEGVFDCAIRYTTKAEYQHPELLKPQIHYCREGETWKKPVDGAFQDLPAHNCFGQIDIKSDP